MNLFNAEIEPIRKNILRVYFSAFSFAVASMLNIFDTSSRSLLTKRYDLLATFSLLNYKGHITKLYLLGNSLMNCICNLLQAESNDHSSILSDTNINILKNITDICIEMLQNKNIYILTNIKCIHSYTTTAITSTQLHTRKRYVKIYIFW